MRFAGKFILGKLCKEIKENIHLIIIQAWSMSRSASFFLIILSN